jgi:hypothetical protein
MSCWFWLVCLLWLLCLCAAVGANLEMCGVLFGEGFPYLLRGPVWVRLSPQMLGLPLYCVEGSQGFGPSCLLKLASLSGYFGSVVLMPSLCWCCSVGLLLLSCYLAIGEKSSRLGLLVCRWLLLCRSSLSLWLLTT